MGGSHEKAPGVTLGLSLLSRYRILSTDYDSYLSQLYLTLRSRLFEVTEALIRGRL